MLEKEEEEEEKEEQEEEVAIREKPCQVNSE